MSTDPKAADHPAADLIAALLAVTPRNPVTGVGAIGYWTSPGSGNSYVTEGDPTPIAARQAVRFLAALAAEANGDDRPDIAGWLNAVEDEIRARHPEVGPIEAAEAAR